ncbi:MULTISPECIES: TetR/AcrR family transcriptional regulator [Paenibacillus]|uniref:TetR family transcriptional regulator n=1 Tax=Paenibacillus naphthalenovorans TaxID=162209 RepID=A0A0U2ULB8_9BACL|nr:MULTISPECIES: TetR/AcrR family transcriptional regulator [Paenibacillus]ALS23884.1 TetR family transcriptional regulator [Paenibacillus naphthalenovorans]NTZ16286.1 TetR/AcrR family transcriptional regulator [Paenibacillus sp. JMULE4]GCL72116.1 TetR/AcrR family transcriptional regulator [Paenibacillus naphthalenovorans]SDI98598.1 DNA-binding transcriptional regulator, AcrR family [Paenibacillus naphthalenovorans]
MSVQKIKSAALRLFARNGYDAVPLSEIAKEVGIKTPSLYAHFRSKEDLFLAVFEDCLAEHTARMAALIESLKGRTIEEQLYRVIHDACRSYLLSEEHMTFLKRVMLFPPAALQETLRERFSASEDQLNGLLTALFNEGMDSGLLRRERPEDLIASYYCLLDGSFIQQFYYKSEDWEHRLDTVWRIYWKGITTS